VNFKRLKNREGETEQRNNECDIKISTMFLYDDPEQQNSKIFK